MTSIPTSTAAFYQFFRDREASAAARQAGDAEGPGRAAPGAAADQGAAAQASAALTPRQVRDRLEALIADQVATGKLTSDQGAALRTSLDRDAPRAAVATGTAASMPDDGPSSGARPPVTGPGGAYEPSAVLAAFIQNLQSGQAGGASYGSAGTAPARNANSRLLDFNT